MGKALVHVHLFKVNEGEGTERDLASLIDSIDEDGLADRMRGVGSADMRLDLILKKRDKADGTRLWYLDFTRFRNTHGPGKVTADDPVEDVPMEPGEHFGEEAAALFLPDYNYVLIQYNHFGVRPKAMEQYFSNYMADETNIYTFSVALDPDAQQRFQRQTQIKKFEIGVDLTQLTDADRRAGNSLRDMALAAADMEGVTMNITVSVGRERQRGLAPNVKNAIRDFLRGNDAITSATVTGRETPDSNIEPVDLLEQKLIHFDGIEPNESWRLPQIDRFKVLRRAYSKWKERIQP